MPPVQAGIQRLSSQVLIYNGRKGNTPHTPHTHHTHHSRLNCAAPTQWKSNCKIWRISTCFECRSHARHLLDVVQILVIVTTTTWSGGYSRFTEEEEVTGFLAPDIPGLQSLVATVPVVCSRRIFNGTRTQRTFHKVIRVCAHFIYKNKQIVTNIT